MESQYHSKLLNAEGLLDADSQLAHYLALDIPVARSAAVCEAVIAEREQGLARFHTADGGDRSSFWQRIRHGLHRPTSHERNFNFKFAPSK